MAKITAFDGKTIHARRVKDPITDDTLPPMGSLNWSNIASSSALSGTTGADCSKVKGDRQLTADGIKAAAKLGDAGLSPASLKPPAEAAGASVEGGEDAGNPVKIE